MSVALDTQALIASAFNQHKAGNLDTAARGYKTVLAWQPCEEYALHLLGDALARQGMAESGLAAVLRAMALVPDLPGLEGNLENVVGLGVQRCRALRAERRTDAALGLLRQLHNALPDDPSLTAYFADSLCELGQREEAIACCTRFLARHPGSDDVLPIFAKARMPGEGYYATLASFHRWRQPAGYLEIGVDAGKALALADRQTYAFGIDPNPAIAFDRLANGARVLHMTSDAFFAEHDLAVELDGRPLDLAFIDGLHTFEQVLRDFMNIEARAHRRTIVLIHDAIPLDEASAARERTTNYWTGDVWRAVLLLRRERPDLSIFTLPVFPTGLCVVTNLDPSSRHLDDRYDSLVAEGMDLSFAVLGDDPDTHMAVRYLDWSATVQAIEEAWSDPPASVNNSRPRSRHS